MKDVYNQIILISTIAAVQLLFFTLLNDLFTITGMATIIIRIAARFFTKKLVNDLLKSSTRFFIYPYLTPRSAPLSSLSFPCFS